MNYTTGVVQILFTGSANDHQIGLISSVSTGTTRNLRGAGGFRKEQKKVQATRNQFKWPHYLHYHSRDSEKSTKCHNGVVGLTKTSFSAFEKTSYDEHSPLTKLIRVLKPSFERSIPSAQRLGGRYLDDFHNMVLFDISIKTHLDSGFGTLLFLWIGEHHKVLCC